MSCGTTGARILHAVPGRVRIHLPGWSKGDRGEIESRFREVAGVRHVRADALTGNVLIRFDPAVTSATILLALARRIAAGCRPDEQPVPARSRPSLPRLASGSVALVSALRVYRRLGRGVGALEAAKLLLRLGVVFSGAFAAPRVQLVVGGAEAVLRVGALLGRRTA